MQYVIEKVDTSELSGVHYVTESIKAELDNDAAAIAAMHEKSKMWSAAAYTRLLRDNGVDENGEHNLVEIARTE
ncbi:MAG: hypothetical protein RR547_07000 [Raoultibacter sp.]